MNKKIIMAVSASVTYVVLLFLHTLPVTNGHGMMVEPAMRSSLWRFNYAGAEPNYNDNGLNCGGFTNQHEKQNGRCGICGDPYQGPRDNEAGGKYAKGIIARTYKAGQYITVTSDITANHGGYIELKLCPHNDYRVPITQQCLDQFILLIKGHGTRYQITTKQKSNFKINHIVKLPDFVTCRQCVLQWYWKAGQHSGIDPITKQECIGCGKQEEFINCADIAITDEFGMFPSVNTAPPRPMTTQFPLYDASFMLQGQGMFPEIFDEYNPFFTTPSYFNQYGNPYMNNRLNFNNGQNVNNRQNFNNEQNLNHRPNVRQQIHNTFTPQQPIPTANTHQNTDFQGTGHQENLQKQRGFYGNGRREHIQEGFNGGIQRSQINIQQTGKGIQNNPSFSTPLATRNTRPLIPRPNSNTNIQRVQMNRNLTNPIIPIINNDPSQTIKSSRNISPVHARKPSNIDNSESTDFMEDLIDDEGSFRGNVEFWNDFYSLLNMSSPNTKQSLYEIAEDADNMDEFHQNVKLLIQMQGNLPNKQPSKNADSDSDESLDMDWLLAEAKDMELDSGEKHLLGITKAGGTSDKVAINNHQLINHKYNIPGQMLNDENRILDDEESDESNSDGFHDNSKSDENLNDVLFNAMSSDDEDFGPTSDDINADYDSSDNKEDNEFDVDNDFNNMAGHKKSLYPESHKQNGSPTNKQSHVTITVSPWNENVLYKTDVLDYDEKDVDVEGDIRQFTPGNKLETDGQDTNQTPKSATNQARVMMNYFESDSRDYSDSESESTSNDLKDRDKSWEDYSDENTINEDSWSFQTSKDNIEADTIIVTAHGEDTASGENENKEGEIEEADNVVSSDKTRPEAKSVRKEEGSAEITTDVRKVKGEKEQPEPLKDENEDLGDIKPKKGTTETHHTDNIKLIKENSAYKGSEIDDVPNIHGKINAKMGLQSIPLNTMDDKQEKMKENKRTGAQSVDEDNEAVNGIHHTVNVGPMYNSHTTVPHVGAKFFSATVGSFQPGSLMLNTNIPLSGNDVTAVYQPSRSSPQLAPVASIAHPLNSGLNNNNQKPYLPTFRKKIKDTISKSMNQNNPGINLDSISTVLKSVDGKDTKKELSQDLSKLVLKMFMNTKSMPPPCSGQLKQVCTPVTLWSKYQQVADWCTSLCPYGNCPSAVCSCACTSAPMVVSHKTCRAQSAFSEKAGELDQWCQKTCSAGDCPDLLCVCT